MGPLQVMIDLETMGNGSNAAITAIGAVLFDNTGVKGQKFYEVVNLASSVAAGGVMDPSTVLWRMKQSEAARKEFERPGMKIDQALIAFSNFISPTFPVWGNGSDFDNVILASAYNRLNIKLPWKYYNNRCYRTMKNMFDIPFPPIQGAHNALIDAMYQAEHLIHICNTVGIVL
jgi:hypothetical protein